MTHEEFDACLLPRKLSFRESEAARQVLVLEMSLDTAAYCCGLDTPEGMVKLKNAIKMITESAMRKN